MTRVPTWQRTGPESRYCYGCFSPYILFSNGSAFLIGAWHEIALFTPLVFSHPADICLLSQQHSTVLLVSSDLKQTCKHRHWYSHTLQTFFYCPSTFPSGYHLSLTVLPPLPLPMYAQGTVSRLNDTPELSLRQGGISFESWTCL